MNETDVFLAFDLYITRIPWCLRGYDLQERYNAQGRYYHVKLDQADSERLIRILNWHHIRYRKYNAGAERASNCRQIFFQHNRPPYRCRYCNKRLTQKDLEVDHVISVYAAQSNVKVQRMMQRRGLTNVNDPSNLVASCRRCNRKKGRKVWLTKAWLGKHKSYWMIRRLVIIVMYSIIAYLLYDVIFCNAEFASGCLQQIIHFIEEIIYVRG